MNKKIGMYSSVLNVFSVSVFAISMILGSSFAGYISSIFIAISFALMMCAYSAYGKKDSKAAGLGGVVFGGIYAALVFLVYFAQVTSVRLDGLNEYSLQIIDFQNFGLYFNYDLLGYACMSLATFFIGFVINVDSKADKCLKILLHIHGIFFISCFVMPILGVFSSDLEGASWIGTVVLEVWCAYFLPVGVLSFFYFKKI